MKIAIVQHEIVWESPQENFDALRPQIARAADTGAGLIALTETFSWGFTLNTDVAREAADGPSTEFLREQAAATGSWIVGSIPVSEGSELPNNRMTFAGPKGELEIYNKIHPFTYGGEHKSYTPGADRHSVTIEGLRISAFLCYDLRFADDFWAMAHETDCYLVIANWPAARRNHWRTLLAARAIENQAWVVGANRAGEDPNVAYSGDSMIIDPFGEILADSGDDSGATILSADVSPKRVAEVRERYPFLVDRSS
jgi:predicted amidohydrolase